MAPHNKARPELRTAEQVLEAFEAELVRTQRPANTVSAYVADARHFARAYQASGGTWT